MEKTEELAILKQLVADRERAQFVFDLRDKSNDALKAMIATAEKASV